MNNKWKEIIVKDEEKNTKLTDFLLKKFENLSFNNLQKLIRIKEIKVNDEKPDINYKLKKNDRVQITNFSFSKLSLNTNNEKKKNNIDEKNFEKFKKSIIYKDENIIAINKEKGLATQGGSGIKESVADYLPLLKFELKENPRLVHRLDKDTTGVLLIARNSQTSEILTKYFKEKTELEKIYLALVVGKINKNEGTINYPLIKKFYNGIEKVYRDEKDGKEAITQYKVISYNSKYNVSLLEVKILTGRTHQIRVHLKELGHPIVGDGKYGGKNAFVEGLKDILYLHSYKIIINSLFNKRNIEIKAEIPKDFNNFI